MVGVTDEGVTLTRREAVVLAAHMFAEFLRDLDFPFTHWEMVPELTEGAHREFVGSVEWVASRLARHCDELAQLTITPAASEGETISFTGYVRRDPPMTDAAELIARARAAATEGFDTETNTEDAKN